MATNAGLLNYNDGSVLNTANSPIGIDNIDHINIPDQDKILLTNQNGVFIKTDTGWYTSTGKNDLFLDFEITGIETASNLYTYVSTNGGGIGRFKYDVDGVSGETIMDSDWTDLETNVINDVFVYDTVQYYATDKGIGFHFSEYTKWDWQIYTRQDGLVSDTALTINRDMEGNLWIGTYRGISKFNGEESWEN